MADSASISSNDLINKLSQLYAFSNEISEIRKRAYGFNQKVDSLQDNLSKNIQLFSNTLTEISDIYELYKKLEKRAENLDKLNILMESYIQCIQIPRQLVESVESNVIDDNFLLQHTYLLAKLDLCNQIPHENYPSLIKTRIKLKQLLELANKRIYQHLQNLMKEGFKDNKFDDLYSNKCLYDHLFKYSSLTVNLRKEYAEHLQKHYLNILDEDFKILVKLPDKNKVKTELRSNLKLLNYLNKILLIQNRDYLLSDSDWKKIFEIEQSGGKNNQPENIFNHLINKIISYNKREIELASKLFDVYDEAFDIKYKAISDFAEIKKVLLPLLEKFINRWKIYLDKSEDIIGHLIILTIIVDINNKFEANGYNQYREILSHVKLMFTAKVQNIISNVINQVVAYNRACVEKHKDYIKGVASKQDQNIEMCCNLIVICMRVANNYNFNTIVKLLNDLVETILNTIISLSAIQDNRIKEDIYVINQLNSLITALNSTSCKDIVTRLEKFYHETCHRHISSQMKLMFKPILEVSSDDNLDKFKSLSNEFVKSHKNILENVARASKQHFNSKNTCNTISNLARESIADIWNQFLAKLEEFKANNPSKDADDLHTASKNIVI